MTRPQDTTAYRDPEVYDVLHSPHTEAEVDLFLRCAREHDAPGGPWLEPACGSGRYLRELSRRGIETTGFDLDEGMLQWARRHRSRARKAAAVRLFRADMADFSGALGRRRFAVAFNPVNTIRHLHDGREVARHLRQIARHLRSGGLYLVGISFSRYGEEEASEDVWVARRGAVAVRQTVQYMPADPRTRMETVYSHLQVDRRGRREYVDSTYQLRSYDEVQWRALVRRSPLRRVAAIDDLGNVVGPDVETQYQIEILRRD